MQPKQWTYKERLAAIHAIVKAARGPKQKPTTARELFIELEKIQHLIEDLPGVLDATYESALVPEK